jgi:hypothetical protein
MLLQYPALRSQYCPGRDEINGLLSLAVQTGPLRLHGIVMNHFQPNKE